MPARRERLYLCTSKNGRPSWILDFPLWWDRRAFFDKYGDRKIDTGNPFYVDYGLLLTAGEAIAWDKRCKEALPGDLDSKTSSMRKAMDLLESRLKEASWVIVESSEWESGLD